MSSNIIAVREPEPNDQNPKEKKKDNRDRPSLAEKDFSKAIIGMLKKTEEKMEET